MLIGSVRIAATFMVFNHTIDEPDHLAAGMEWLDAGKYRYEDQHPPLARIFGALGPFLAGERWHTGPNSYHEGYRLLGRDGHYDRVLALGRSGILPFFWVGSLVVFLWGYRVNGPAAALISTLIFTTIPPVLAHSGLITTDMAAAGMIGATAFVSLLWAELPSRIHTFAFGGVLGLAMLSKFSAPVFLPAAWLLMYAWHLIRDRPGYKRAVDEIWRRKRSIAAVLGIAFLVIWAGYRFSFARVEFLHCRLPAPRFFSGIHAVWEHNQAGHSSYLLGKRSTAGFWYYYPVVLAVKTPLGMLLLLLCMPWVMLRARKSFGMPLAFSLGILFCALMSRINIGVRHVLPVYVGFSVLCGGAAAAALRARGNWPKAGFAGLLIWHVASGALQHPDYLAYTNEIARDRPEAFVADSDLDWGQDMKRLGEYLNRARASDVTFVPFNRTYAALAGHPFPRMSSGDADHPSPGWNAVSISVWKIFGYPSWPDGMEPQVRIGRSILLWYFPPGESALTPKPAFPASGASVSSAALTRVYETSSMGWAPR